MRAVRAISVLCLVVLAGCASAPEKPRSDIPDGAQLTHRAVFIGKSNHLTEGTVSLYQAADPAVIVFEPNFKLSDNIAAPVVALGWNGFRSDAIVGTLNSKQGRQVFQVPKKLRRYRFNQVWLWNTKRNEPVGLALLTPM